MELLQQHAVSVTHLHAVAAILDTYESDGGGSASVVLVEAS